MAKKSSYDKKLLGLGIVLGLCAAGTGVALLLTSENKAPVSPVANKQVDPPAGIAAARKAQETIKADHNLAPISHGESAFSQQYVGFVAPRLWLANGSKEPIDIVKAKPLHAEVPNEWFLQNGLQDILIYSDALSRDPDNDGFTVLEEYDAKTEPNNPKSHPDLLTKLFIEGIKRQGFYLVFSQVDEETGAAKFKGTNRNDQELWRADVKEGDRFGVRKGSNDKPRFQLVKVENKEFRNERLNMTESGQQATVMDLAPYKNKKIYEIRNGSRGKESIVDVKAELIVTAGTEHGKIFTVEEGAEFSIPGDDSKTRYIMKSIDHKTQTATIVHKDKGTVSTLKKQK